MGTVGVRIVNDTGKVVKRADIGMVVIRIVNDTARLV